MTAEEIIAALGLKPHPEGGHYKETFRDSAKREDRAHSTAIYYLLKKGERSHWHRIDAVEIWHYYAGDALALEISADECKKEHHTLGPDVMGSELPQVIVRPNAWQSARTLGEWTLVGCTVAPGFDSNAFELAPPDWEPATRSD